MKKLIFILIAIGITLGCNNDDNVDLSGVNSNTKQKNFKIEAIGSPKLEVSHINCIPDQLADAILKEGFDINGNLEHLFGTNFINGELMISSCNHNFENKEITTLFYGTLVDDDADILYYNGKFIISYKEEDLNIRQNQNLRGFLNISDGSGKYEFIKSDLINLIGSIDFITGKKSFTGEGYVNFNNRYDY